MTETPQTPAPKAAKGSGRWLLIMSLTLNLLVLGVVVGGLVAHGGRLPRPGGGDISLGVFTEALSEADRATMRRAAMAQVPEFREMRRAARADHARMIAALRAEPWDRADLEAVMAANRTRTLERMEWGQRMILERVAAMTPDERRAFAARLEQGLRRGDRDRSHRRDTAPER